MKQTLENSELKCASIKAAAVNMKCCKSNKMDEFLELPIVATGTTSHKKTLRKSVEFAERQRQ